MARILVIEDDRSLLTALQMDLQDSFYVETSLTGFGGLKIAGEKNVDVVILDFSLGDTNALKLIPELRELHDPPEIIILTGEANGEDAASCIKLGAFDFFQKPYEIDKFLTSINNAINKKSLLKQRLRFLKQSRDNYRLIGSSLSMQNLQRSIRQCAENNNPVLIMGEMGTGKELVARQIHLHSPRASEYFQWLNCASIPRELIESELFGHAKGAFSSAYRDKQGKLEAAEGGSLFLDEIGDMHIELQSRLLRVLEYKEFERVGENHIRNADIRVIAATNINLYEAMEKKKFRADLYYRISTNVISIPPLRERLDDIPELLEYFSDKFSIQQGCARKDYHDDVIDFLRAYSWPGNVREMQNVVARIYANFPHDERVGKAEFEQVMVELGQAGRAEASSNSLEDLMDEYEKKLIIGRVRQFNGNLGDAAKSLKIHRSTLHRKLVEHGIDLQKNIPVS